jgi:drug/metabolite transporter (DMT)-like permease
MTQSSKSRLKDWLLLVVCNFIWGSYFVMVKLVQKEIGPFVATFLPITLATGLLGIFIRLKQAKQGQAAASMLPPKRDLFEFVLIGIFGMVVTQLFGTWGTGLSLASNGALLMLALPVATALMAYSFLGERMTTIRWISFFLSIAGVLQCSRINWQELNLSGSQYFLGNLMLFASVFGSAFYNVYSKKLLTRYSPLEVLRYSYLVVVVFLFPITLYEEPGSFARLLELTPSAWIGLALLTFFHYFLSMVIFLNALTRLDATQAGLANYLIPFFGVLMAVLFLEERLTLSMIAGGVLVLAGTLMITVYEERQRIRAAAVTRLNETTSS